MAKKRSVEKLKAEPLSTPKLEGYYQYPQIFGEEVFFVTDDDLWKVSKEGGFATRLTTGLGLSTRPFISPNGNWIAYSGFDSGFEEIYLISSQGGPTKRLTFLNGAQVSNWSNDKTLIIQSSYESFNSRIPFLYSLNIETLEIKNLGLGPGNYFAQEKSLKIIGRNIGDPAKWKRYRGGAAGTIWVQEGRTKLFSQILIHLKSNLSNPILIRGKIYFISDHEGIGNIYCCDTQGKKVIKLTNEKKYYVRSFHFNQGQFVYMTSGKIKILNKEDQKSYSLSISTPSNFIQAQTRFESADRHLQDFILSPSGKMTAFICRGQIFFMPPWTGGPIRLGENKLGVRYKNIYWSKNENQIISVSLTPDKEEQIVVFSIKTLRPKTYGGRNWGKIWDISPSPNSDWVAISNNRNQLWLLNLKNDNILTVEKGPKSVPGSTTFSPLSWSPNGKFLAYQAPFDEQRTGIKIYSLSDQRARFLMDPILHDTNPRFCPSGKYLYFIGIREFYPQYNETDYDLGFPHATRPYAVLLQKDGKSPFLGPFDPDSDEDDDRPKGKTKEKSPKKTSLKIDYNGIDQRILGFPVEIGGYSELWAFSDRILFTKSEGRTFDPHSHREVDYNDGLYSYHFKDGKTDLVHSHVHTAVPSMKSQHLLVETDHGIKLIPSDFKISDHEEEDEHDFTRKSGWIDLNRIKVKINPKDEWKQMYREAWDLQREHFWTPKIKSKSWENVYAKYLPLLENIHTRSEFSDLLWEMQGELETSHCYEMEGDYFQKPRKRRIGYLGAQFKFLPKENCYLIQKIYKGDSWMEGNKGPLASVTPPLVPGDRIYSLDGQKVAGAQSLNEYLEGKDCEVINLQIKRKGKSSKEYIEVKTLSGPHKIQYREWVQKNLDYVIKKSRGRLGYIHIPNMGISGYADFFRQYLSQFHKAGLVIDVRYNEGGNVSEYILKVLSQKILGHSISRWSGNEKIPSFAPSGPMVCLTNEHAGSDGDIFSHSFKLLKLGKLIGKRTWGGIIGIWPRNYLNDGTWTSQPEFATSFKDVGLGLENFGTLPDIEIEITPKDWSQGTDPQLESAIKVLIEEL